MYVHHGGDPRVFDELPWQDIADWLAIHDVLETRAVPGGIQE